MICLHQALLTINYTLLSIIICSLLFIISIFLYLLRRKDNKLLNNLLLNSNSGYFIVDPKTYKIINASKTLSGILKTDIKNIIGKKYQEIIEFNNDLPGLIKLKINNDYVVTCSIIKHESISRSVFYITKIPEYDNIKQKLDNIQAYFDAIFNYTQIGIVIVNGDTNKIININGKALQLIQSSRNKVIGSEFNNYFGITENIKELFVGETSFQENVETELFNTKNEKLNVLKSSVCLNIDEHPVIITGFIDITEHKNVIDQLEKAKFHAESANRSKSEFLANMSHELRTPMNAIMGISKMMQKYSSENLTEKQVEGLQVIHNSGNRLLDLINDVLDLSKIEAGKMTINSSPLSLQRLFFNLKIVIDTLIKDKNLKFTIRKSHHIPDQIISDEKKLNQVLLNLLGNAAKFTNEGKIVLRVHDIKDKLYFEVQDTGIGMEEEALAHVFKEFYQVDSSSSRKYSGTGLGLTLCKKLTQLLGGDIEIESEVNIGTIVKFYIPYKYPKISAEEESTSQNEKNKLNDTSKVVMVIDDDLSTQYMLKGFLNQNGYRAIFSSEIENAFKIIEDNSPDYIILDNDFSGNMVKQLISKINNSSEYKNIPIILTSVNNITPEYYYFGFNTFLRKPLNESELLLKFKTFDQLTSNSKTEVLVIGDSEQTINEINNLLQYNNIKTISLSEHKYAVDLIEKLIPQIIILSQLSDFEYINHTMEFLNTHNNRKIKNIETIIYTGSNLELIKKWIDGSSTIHWINTENSNSKDILLKCKELVNQKLNKKILIAEDEKEGRFTLRMMLEKEYDIVFATNGEEAVDLYFQENPDIVLMDISMPKLDGYKAFEKINASNKANKTKIIALTGKVMQNEKEKILKHGFDDYLAKPIDQENLIKKIEHHLYV